MIPHHHHGEEVCFAVESDVDADGHCHDGHNKTSCSSYQHYLKGSQCHQRTVGSCSVSSIAHIFMSSVVPLGMPMNTECNGYYYISHYQSTKLFGSSGLRAPPFPNCDYLETE